MVSKGSNWFKRAFGDLGLLVDWGWTSFLGYVLSIGWMLIGFLLKQRYYQAPLDFNYNFPGFFLTVSGLENPCPHSGKGKSKPGLGGNQKKFSEAIGRTRAFEDTDCVSCRNIPYSYLSWCNLDIIRQVPFGQISTARANNPRNVLEYALIFADVIIIFIFHADIPVLILLICLKNKGGTGISGPFF